MATELKTIKGKFQSKTQEKLVGGEMFLTRFSGGKEGMKVQLTISTSHQDDLFTHITFDKEGIKQLIEELKESFDLG